jgi:hypothetical protein
LQDEHGLTYPEISLAKSKLISGHANVLFIAFFLPRNARNVKNLTWMQMTLLTGWLRVMQMFLLTGWSTARQKFPSTDW